MREETTFPAEPADDQLADVPEPDDPETWPAAEPTLDPEVDPADFADQQAVVATDDDDAEHAR